MKSSIQKSHSSKIILSLLAIFLFVSTIIPSISFADDNHVSLENNTFQSIQLKENLVIDSSESKYTILKGQKLYLIANNASEKFIQIENTSVSVPNVEYEEIISDEIEKVEYLPTISKGEISLTDEVAIYSDDLLLNQFGTIKSSDNFTVLKETDLSYQILFGNRSVYISKADVTFMSEEIEEDHSGNKPVAEEATQEKEHVEVEKEKTTVSTTNTNQSEVTKESTHFQIKGSVLSVYDNSTGSLKKVGALTSSKVFPIVEVVGNWIKIEFGDGFGYVWKESAVSKNDFVVNSNESGDSSPTAYNIKSEKYLSVYDNSTGELVQFGSIDPNVVYPVIKEMGDWYQVRLAGKVGYVYKPAATKVFTQNDKYIKVTTEFLSIYDNSSGKLVRVGSLEKGQVFPRISDAGNWHKIAYKNGYGYVWKESTEPANANSLKNLNSGQKSTSKKIVSNQYLSVYDNTSGALVRFAQIIPKVEYPVISSVGNWYIVDVSGRIGYVYKPATREVFESTDRYFEVIGQDVPVYDNRSGSLEQVGTLKKGQVFPREGDTGNWHKIKFNGSYGYVWKESTTVGNVKTIGNLNPGYVNQNQHFVTKQNVQVYDNSSGKLEEFATLEQGISYKIISRSGNWVLIDVLGRVGYVYSTGVQFGPVITHNTYDLSLEQMLNIQMGVSPQTDKYRYNKVYVEAANIAIDTKDPNVGLVTSTFVEVKDNTSSLAWTYGKLKFGAKVEIVAKVGSWYEIKYGTWRNAMPGDVSYYIDPNNFQMGSKSYYQFLDLSKSTSATALELNSRILVEKGILQNMGDAFITAGSRYHINEIYLISHALLETGNGSSRLANGILVDTVDGKKIDTPRIVYNMFGIQAKDSCPDVCGSEYAYKQGWFTPEAAIIGGAEFISKQYVNNATYKQNTLYKMRWNPGKPGTHQYATDVGWAYKQVSNIEKLYKLLDSYTLYYDVPVFK